MSTTPESNVDSRRPTIKQLKNIADALKAFLEVTSDECRPPGLGPPNEVMPAKTHLVFHALRFDATLWILNRFLWIPERSNEGLDSWACPTGYPFNTHIKLANGLLIACDTVNSILRRFGLSVDKKHTYNLVLSNRLNCFLSTLSDPRFLRSIERLTLNAADPGISRRTALLWVPNPVLLEEEFVTLSKSYETISEVLAKAESGDRAIEGHHQTESSIPDYEGRMVEILAAEKAHRSKKLINVDENNGHSVWGSPEGLQLLQEIDKRHSIERGDPKVYSIAAYLSDFRALDADLKKYVTTSMEEGDSTFYYASRKADCQARHFPGKDVDSIPKLWRMIDICFMGLEPNGERKSWATPEYFAEALKDVYFYLHELKVPWAYSAPYPSLTADDMIHRLKEIANRLEREELVPSRPVAADVATREALNGLNKSHERAEEVEEETPGGSDPPEAPRVVADFNTPPATPLGVDKHNDADDWISQKDAVEYARVKGKPITTQQISNLVSKSDQSPFRSRPSKRSDRTRREINFKDFIEYLRTR